MKTKTTVKMTSIILCLIVLITSMPSFSAMTDNQNEKDGNNNPIIESGFMIGIMHVQYVKCGWGWKEVMTPFFIIRIGSQGRHILGPLSGPIEPYRINGYLGPLYHMHSYLMNGGFFFICAYVT